MENDFWRDGPAEGQEWGYYGSIFLILLIVTLIFAFYYHYRDK